MEVALRDMLRNAASQQKQLCVEELNAILDALTRPEPQAQPDWDEIAARWLDLIRPIWYERLKRPRPLQALVPDWSYEIEPTSGDFVPVGLSLRFWAGKCI